MSLIRIANSNELRTSHIVMLTLLLLALAGNCLLTSAGKPQILPDGALAWDPDSILLALVEILDLQYLQPTPNGVAVKALVHGVATGLGIFIAVLGLVALSRSAESPTADETVIDVDTYGSSGTDVGLTKRQLDPIRTAQALMAAYLAWSFASSLWSHAPAYARGGAMWLLLQAGWAFALGFGLNRRGAWLGAQMLAGVLAVTAALAIAYFGERNPTLRASYPIGNPLFLAGCLLPGLLLALIGAVDGLHGALRRKSVGAALRMLLFVAAGAAMAYAFQLTQSRGPSIALGVGLGALVFFAGGRKVRIVVVVATVLGLAITAYAFLSQSAAESLTGRGASMRTRFYAWSYGLDLFQHKPAQGHGQGAYTLLADDLASGDVLDDPQPLKNWIAHAHNEWLEVGSDLGAIGLVLIGGALLLTAYGGTRALNRIPSRAQRGALIALLAALCALVIDECTSVGLRIEGLPLVFYTVVGLIWALAGTPPEKATALLARRRTLGILVALAGLLGGALLINAARLDFAGARRQYDTADARRRGDWTQAENLLWSDGPQRLSPQRRLGALRERVASHLQLAGLYQQQHLERRQSMEDADRYDPQLLDRAQQSRRLSEAHVAAGYQALAELQQVCSSPIDRGRIEYGLRLVHALFAELDADPQTAAQLRASGVEALRTQLVRQPFDAAVALQLVVDGGGQMDVAGIVELLARPLRLSAVPPAYVDFLSRYGPSTAYQTEAPALVAAARQSAAQAPADWDNHWSPETLRLAAVIDGEIGAYQRAVENLQIAAGLYAKLDAGVALARASTHLELSNALLRHNPTQPAAAIAAAEEAVKRAPQSQHGRLLCDMAAARLVVYHLAADHEDFARTIVCRDRPDLDDATVDALIADTYVRLGYEVFSQAFTMAPTLLDKWSIRARELDPEAPPVWFFAADIAIHHRKEPEALAMVAEVIRTGGDRTSIVDLLRRGVQAMPESTELRRLLDESQRPAPAAPPQE